MLPFPQIECGEGMGRLTIIEFLATDRERYLHWDRFRRRVFADELGWRLAPQSLEAGEYSDPFDEHAQFFVAEYDTAPVGIVRGLRLTYGFPHRQLFEHHLQASGLDKRIATLGMVNALAVTPTCRRRMFANESDGQLGTASALLLYGVIHSLATSGVSVILATVLSAISAHVFIRAGFSLLDAPFLNPNDNRFVLANVGLVLGAGRAGGHTFNSAMQPETWAASVREYFERVHADVLSKGPIDELFSSPRTNRP